ncbi:hypothetical protein ACX8XN_07000 [Calditrichota bacterium GD2]
MEEHEQSFFPLNKPTAILVDGAFFLKRYRKGYPGGKFHSPQIVAKN